MVATVTCSTTRIHSYHDIASHRSSACTWYVQPQIGNLPTLRGWIFKDSRPDKQASKLANQIPIEFCHTGCNQVPILANESSRIDHAQGSWLLGGDREYRPGYNMYLPTHPFSSLASFFLHFNYPFPTSATIIPANARAQ